MDLESKYDRGVPATEISVGDIHSILNTYLSGRKIESSELLSGGYLNTNYLLTFGNGEKVIFRKSNRPKPALGIEISILKNLNKNILSPKPLLFNEDQNFAVLEYIPGKPLYKVEDKFSKSECEVIAKDIGKALALIHSRVFPNSGEFNSKFSVENPMENFSEAIDFETNRCLQSEFLKSRLKPEQLDKVKKFIDKNKFILNDLTQDRLTHCDFNGKNILVSKVSGKWRLSGIIDWEYAFSGPPLYDFGNFFRFKEEMPPYLEYLTREYRSHGGHLPENWRQVSLYLDLLPQLQFLAREQEQPKTFESAKLILFKTIDNWQGL